MRKLGIQMKKGPRLLLATAVLAVAFLVLVRPDQIFDELETANEVKPTESPTLENEAIDELVQIGLDAGLPMEAAEEIAEMAENPNLESVPEFAGRLVEIIEADLSSDPADLPNAAWLRPSGSPMELAEVQYTSKWKEFVEGMELQNTDAVRRILTEWEAQKFEVNRMFRDGEISPEEFARVMPDVNHLWQILAPHLSQNQLVDITANHEAWLDYSATQRADMSQYLRSMGYRSGVFNTVDLDDADLTRTLIRAGENVNSVTLDGKWTPLLRASGNGNVEIARMLIDAGSEVNWVSVDGYSALTEAATNGHTDMVRLLAEEGADLDFVSDALPYYTPLVHAAQQNHTHVVRELLDQGADVEGMTGTLALSWARDYGNGEMEQMLRGAGARGF